MYRTLIFSVVIFLSVLVYAQVDPGKVLDKVSDRYKNLKSINASVSLRTLNKDSDIDETSSIEFIKKGDKFRFSIDKDLEVVSDNKTIWTISPEDKEVTIDVYEEETDEDEINFTNVFTIHEKGFEKYYIEDKVVDGSVKCHLIDLVPEDKEKDFFKIKVLVNVKDHFLKEMRILYKDGTNAIYSIKGFKYNQTISDARFSVNKEDYKDFHFEDLR